MSGAWKDVAANSSDVESFEQSLGKLRAVGGYGDVSPLAAQLLRSAEADDDAQQSLKFAKLAKIAAPSDPRPRSFTLQLYLGKIFSPLSAGVELGEYVKNILFDPWIQAMAALRLLTVLSVAGWIAVLVAVVHGSALLWPLLIHDYVDGFPRGFRRFVPYAFLLVFVAFSFAIGAGWALFPLVLGLFLSPYMVKRGKIFFTVAAVAACFLPFVVEMSSKTLGTPGARAWSIYRVWRGDAGADLASDIDKSFDPSDAEGAFIAARTARRAGDFSRAEKILSQGASEGNLAALFKLELGNIYFFEERFDDALKQYEELSAEDPNDPASMFNIYAAHLAKMDLMAAETAFAKYKELGPEAAKKLKTGTAAGGNKIYPITRDIPTSWVMRKLFTSSDETGWSPLLGKGLFGWNFVGRPEGYAVLFLVLFFSMGKILGGKRSGRCPSCGLVICPRCSRRVSGSRLCPGCWIAGREKNIDSTEKERLSDLAEAWERKTLLWGKIGRMVFPGWNDFLQGAFWHGFLLLLVWLLAGGWIVVHCFYAAPIVPWGEAPSILPAIAVLIAAHVVSIVLTIKHSSQTRDKG